MQMNKVCIVTGASQGIGKATAAYFAERGWSVVNLSRNLCELENVTNLTVDFSQPDWEQACQQDLLNTVQTAEQICLVHNSAVLYKDRIDDLPSAQLRRALEINVVAPAILNQCLLPVMQSGSAIIYVGSTLAEKAVAQTASYVISKHALVGMMRATCQDLAGRDITTACVCPGFTDTEMLRSHIGHDANLLRAIEQSVSGQRLIHPSEIAATIYCCATQPVLNGAVLHANLGQLET